MAEEPTQEQLIEAVYAFAAEQMQAGVRPAEIENRLVERGLSPEDARTVVDNAREVHSKGAEELERLSKMLGITTNTHEAHSQAIREEARKNMLFGALWCGGGIVLTVGTLMAAQGGGTYVVAWGAIIFGAIQFFRGLIQSGDTGE